jgi:hypothetical protein
LRADAYRDEEKQERKKFSHASEKIQQTLGRQVSAKALPPEV